MPGRARFATATILLLLIASLLVGCGGSDDKPIFTTTADLEGYRVGIVTGSTFDQLSKEVWDDFETVYLSAFNDMIPYLTSNKIDCFITDLPWAKYMSGVNSEITYFEETLADEQYGLVFAKNEHGAAVRDDFNAFLAELPDREAVFAELEEIWVNPDPDAHPDMDYSSLPATNGTIYVCTDTANPPFEYFENNRIVGYDINLIYMFCKARGYAMVVDDMKFDSLIPAVSSGKYDIASSSFAITAERQESVYFSDPVYQGGPVVTIRKENSAEGQDAAEGSGFFSSIAQSFEKTFIREGRWKLFVSGIGRTLLITAVSLVAGTVLGFLMYMWCRKGGKVSAKATGLLSWLITGMPEVLLLLIMFYIVFAGSPISGTWVSSIAFTLIVGVSVLGLMKSGVAAIDRGQMEAALAIGYSDRRAFFRIIVPQALQFIMPGYRSMVISLIKSTAIVGYLAVQDLTKVSDIIRSRTYEAFFPLVATAAIYFVLAWLLVKLVDHIQIELLPIRRSRKAILKGLDVNEEDFAK